MLTVKTSLRPSATHGIGVFAEQFIPAGTVVWQFQPDFDFRVSEESVAALPEIARQRLLHYSAKWGGGYVISADDARFLNHSETPNLRTHDEPDCDIAIRDIQIGEELFEDYREFDDTFAGRPINRGIGSIRVKEKDMEQMADHCYTIRDGKGREARIRASEAPTTKLQEALLDMFKAAFKIASCEACKGRRKLLVCHKCREVEGSQHRPSCERQGIVSARSTYLKDEIRCPDCSPACGACCGHPTVLACSLGLSHTEACTGGCGEVPCPDCQPAKELK